MRQRAMVADTPTVRNTARARHGWLAGLGIAAAAGGLVLSQFGAASAASAGPVAAARPSAATVRPAQAVPGSAYTPTGQVLKFGMTGPAVKALQQRLAFLHYFVGKIDGRFGWDTQEGVWAFKEVQTGIEAPPNASIVGPAMQRQLVHPRLPKVLFPHGNLGSRTRIEVNKKIEVLVLYRRDKVVLISHVSSASRCRPDGCGWFTPGGFHRASYYIPGKVADNSFGRSFMYWPVFFINYTYAIHGFPNPKWGNRFYGVPLKPASHGCVRIPLDLSKILHTMIHVSPTNGTPVWIYPVNPPNWTSSAPIRWLRPGQPG
jgi:hypothetical protein